MANTTALKRRIGSVRNTRQITKAMELVAASKMRRAQSSAISGREYHALAVSLLRRLRELTDVHKHPLYTQRTVKNKLYVVIASDRGLAGAFNSNVLKQFSGLALEDRSNGIGVSAIAIGRQAATFLSKIDGVETLGSYVEFPDNPQANDIKPILDTLVEQFESKKVDEVRLVFTDFKSSLSQVVTHTTLLPAAVQTGHVPISIEDADFEPSAEAVLESVTTRFIEIQLYQAILESIASEHSARMMAMKSASDNAAEIIDDLTLAFNTARQAAITQELAEITAGAEAIS